MAADLEKEDVQIHYVTGYASLVAFIARDPDHSTAIYRRFDELSARNLLYLQSELAELKARQDELYQQDWKGDLKDKRPAKDWKVLKDHAGLGDANAKERMELVHEIRAKLKEYRDALVMESTMLSLRRPAKQTFYAFLDYFKHDDYTVLGGRNATLYDKREDLVALCRSAEEDRLTMMLRKHFAFLFQTKRETCIEGIGFHSEERIRKVVALISMVLAARLLYGAILNFYFVTSEKAKLGLIAAYTAAFALCVGLLTNAKRSEIFAACAAYAAVIVVFVSSDLGNSNGSSGTASTLHGKTQ